MSSTRAAFSASDSMRAASSIRRRCSRSIRACPNAKCSDQARVRMLPLLDLYVPRPTAASYAMVKLNMPFGLCPPSL
ncbi:protein of unknown function [Magnetospirillum sp. XM-1]|nr:protein of unknown function [Magnetospirillum sp. XM-1]